MIPHRERLRQRPEIRRIAALLRSRRKQLGLTQEQMGARVGLGSKYWSMLENGDRILPLPSLLHILDKIGMKLEIRAATSDDGPDDLDLVQAAESLLEDLEAFVRLLRRRSGA